MSRLLLILVTIASYLQNSAQSQSYDHLRDGYQLYENVIPIRDEKTSVDLTADSDEFGYGTNIERNIPLMRKKLKQKTFLDNSDLSSTELELLESISIPPSLLPSKHSHRPGHKPRQPERRPGSVHGHKKPKESHAMKSDTKLKGFRFPKPTRLPKLPKPTRTPKRPKPEAPDLDFIPRPPPDESNES